MSARPDTWMAMYWGDYARDTGHLNAAGHGAYLMLIKHYWCTGLPLCDDDNELWRIACCDSKKEWLALRSKIIRLFRTEDGLLRHKRIDQELSTAGASVGAKTVAGREGGATRWGSTEKAGRGLRSQRLAAARAIGTHTKEEWEALLDVVGRKCLRCSVSEHMAFGGICKDHIIPIYQGGSDAIANLQPMCCRCNSRKGPDSSDLRPLDWMERLQKRLARPVQEGILDGNNSQGDAIQMPTPSPSPKEAKQLLTESVPRANRERDPANGAGPPRWPDARIVESQGRPSCNGIYIDSFSERLAEAACLPLVPLADKTMLGWLADGYETDEILPVIRRVVERSGQAPKSLAYFDKAVREMRPTYHPLPTAEQRVA